MGFQEEHDRWLRNHMRRRKGERLDALRRGHGYGNRLFVEQIWWALVGHFDGLHPEYEVKDWRGRSYYADFIWLVGALRIIIEIMDYGSHGTDRTKFRMDLNRGLFLQSQQCLVINIPLDELKENPGFILTMLRHTLAPYLETVDRKRRRRANRRFSRIERELMRAAVRRNRIIRPVDAVKELELDTNTVIKYCRLLVDKGKFRPVARGKSQRVIYYEYVGSITSPDLV